MLLVEIAAHLGRLFLGAAQTGAQRFHHLHFVFGALAAGVGLLYLDDNVPFSPR